MTVLNVKNLSKHYDATSGIMNFDMTLQPGDITLLLGPNGAGKTTTFRSILGLVKSQYDRLEILESTFDRTQTLYEVGAMISKPVFYEYLTGKEHLKLFASFYDKVTDYHVDETIKTVGLKKAEDKKIAQYSTGMKQRLDLARALIHQPKLLLLDEPFNGMDIEAKHEFKMLLKTLQSQRPLGIVISSHMVGDLEQLANKVIIIYEGQTLFNGTMAKIHQSGLGLEEFYLERLSAYKKGLQDEAYSN